MLDGETLTFGGTKWIRAAIGDAWGIGDPNDQVDYGSASYGAGEWVGTAHELAFGVAGGLKAAGAKGLGNEFSHWVPRRYLGALGKRVPALKGVIKCFDRSLANGNFISPARHFLNDPFRYLKGTTKAAKTWPGWAQQLDRVPRLHYGILSGWVWSLAHDKG